MVSIERKSQLVSQYDTDGRIPVTPQSLQEIPGLPLAIAMYPDDFKPEVTVSVREATEKEARIGNIALAELRMKLGMELEIPRKDLRILNDPKIKTPFGTDMQYISDRVIYGYGVSGAVKKFFGRLF